MFVLFIYNSLLIKPLLTTHYSLLITHYSSLKGSTFLPFSAGKQKRGAVVQEDDQQGGKEDVECLAHEDAGEIGNAGFIDLIACGAATDGIGHGRKVCCQVGIVPPSAQGLFHGYPYAFLGSCVHGLLRQADEGRPYEGQGKQEHQSADNAFLVIELVHDCFRFASKTFVSPLVEHLAPVFVHQAHGTGVIGILVLLVTLLAANVSGDGGVRLFPSRQFQVAVHALGHAQGVLFNVLETDLKTLNPEMTLGELVKVIAQSNRNIFPVVDGEGKLLGILLLDEVRNIMFQPRLYNRFTVKQLMNSPQAIITNTMPMGKVMEVFEDTGAWNLPVVDEQKKYLGFVSKSKIFNSYRHVLVHFSEE